MSKKTDKAVYGNKEVGRRVRELYKAHGMTQEQLAGKLHYSDGNMISMIVNGRRALTKDVAMKLVELFPEVSLDWLMGLTPHKTKTSELLYDAAEAIDDRDSMVNALQSFLYRTRFVLSVTDDVPPRYIFFDGNNELPLSVFEIDCFCDLIRRSITSHVDFLFRQEKAQAENRQLMKKLREVE